MKFMHEDKLFKVTIQELDKDTKEVIKDVANDDEDILFRSIVLFGDSGTDGPGTGKCIIINENLLNMAANIASTPKLLEAACMAKMLDDMHSRANMQELAGLEDELAAMFRQGDTEGEE